MNDRLEIASRLLAVVVPKVLNSGVLPIHNVCESCLDAADALIKSEQDTRHVAGEERQLLEDLSQAQPGHFMDLKERAKKLFGVT